MRTIPSRRLVPGLVAFALLAVGCGERAENQSGAAPAREADEVIDIQIGDLGYVTGLDDAPVTVIEFSDFGCPFCASFALNSYPEIHSEFVLSGRVRWIYLPFVTGRFPNGDTAALAAECAGEQTRFWQMHYVLYSRQDEWRRGEPADALFAGYAKAIGLDEPRFELCYRDRSPQERSDRQNALAQQAGVRATPTFFIDGRPIEGALPPEHFRTLLDWAVEAARDTTPTSPPDASQDTAR